MSPRMNLLEGPVVLVGIRFRNTPRGSLHLHWFQLQQSEAEKHSELRESSVVTETGATAQLVPFLEGLDFNKHGCIYCASPEYV